VGVAISDVSDLAVSGSTPTGVNVGLTPTIFLPINVGSRFRVEPEIGFFRNTISDTGALNRTETVQGLHAGAGAFILAKKDRFTLYYGARGGYIRRTSSVSVGGSRRTDDTIPGYFVAPAIGGEYFLSDYLSLGGEVQVRFSSLDWKRPPTANTTSFTFVATHGALTVRFYFPH
jgi:hypothetical protein